MIVLDASALLAFIKNETGAAVVAAHMNAPLLSTINLAETLSRLAEDGVDPGGVADRLKMRSPIQIVPASEAHAHAAAILRPLTKQWGLSLGDRMCFALARERQLPVLTADQAWKHVKVGVTVTLIR